MLKNELVHDRRDETHEQTRREICYNRQRRRSRRGHRSPVAFTQQWARHHRRREAATHGVHY